MKKSHFIVAFPKIITLLLLIFLAGCQIYGNEQSAIPNPTLSTKWKTTPISLTITSSTIPTESPTITIVPTITSTPVFLPPPGEYIAYTNGKSIQLVSLTGKEAGILMKGAREGRNWLSPNQEIIAYSDELHILHFRNIYSGEINTIQEQETCKFGVADLSWNPEGDKIVITCSTGRFKNELIIMTYPEGKIIGRIEKIIDFDKNATNIPEKPAWSPDGKWIAFFVHSGHQLIGDKGPFITDTSCFSNDTTCASKTRLLIDSPKAVISWTTDSKLAIKDYYSDSIIIYQMPSLFLIQTINIPAIHSGDFSSFAWSHNDEWFTFGGINGIFIMSRITGEIGQISNQPAEALFWIEIK